MGGGHNTSVRGSVRIVWQRPDKCISEALDKPSLFRMIKDDSVFSEWNQLVADES